MNNVQLIGRLTKDPEVRYNNQTGKAIGRFSIAIDRMPDKNGEKKADFPSIVCFDKKAEMAEKYLRKGRLIGITGRIQTGSYEGQDGKKVYTTDIIADQIEFLDRAEKEEPKETKSSEDQVYMGFENLKDEDIPF